MAVMQEFSDNLILMNCWKINLSLRHPPLQWTRLADCRTVALRDLLMFCFNRGMVMGADEPGSKLAFRIRNEFWTRPCSDFLSGQAIRQLVYLHVDPSQLASAKGADLERIYEQSSPEIQSVIFEAVSRYQPQALADGSD